MPSSACGASDGLVKSMKHGLALGGCGVPLPAPPGEKNLQRFVMGGEGCVCVQCLLQLKSGLSLEGGERRPCDVGTSSLVALAGSWVN